MRYDLRFAWRMILAQRWFSLAVVVTLALGIGLNTMVFTLVNAALFKPVDVPGGSRLVTVDNYNQDFLQQGYRYRFSLPETEDYRAQVKSLAGIEGTDDLEGVI